MEIKKFHKKNYFSIGSVRSIPNNLTISIDKTNETYLKRFKQFNLKNNQKKRQKRKGIQKI